MVTTEEKRLLDLELMYSGVFKDLPRWHSLQRFGLTHHFAQTGVYHMAATSFFMELRINFKDENRASKEEHLKSLMAQFGNVLLSHATLLQDRTEPYLSMVKSDSINGTEQIKVSDFQVGSECPACGHEIESQDECSD